MSINEVTRMSREGIQLVQNYIEQCIQQHMNLDEMKNTLLVKAKIEPKFTELVWQKLQGDNPEFFKAYHLRLLVKDQIVKFNRLLERQAELMSQQSAGPSTFDMSDGSHIPFMSKRSEFYGQQYAGSQSSNMELVQGMNEQMMKPEASYINGFHCEVPYYLHADGEIPVSSYNNVESHSQPIDNNTLLGANAAYESLGQITRSFSLPDGTSDFSLDVFGSYSGSPFLEADSDSFLNPQHLVEQQDNGRSNKISEELTNNNLGSH